MAFAPPIDCRPDYRWIWVAQRFTAAIKLVFRIGFSRFALDY
jgi:hypothetical protein